MWQAYHMNKEWLMPLNDTVILLHETDIMILFV